MIPLYPLRGHRFAPRYRDSLGSRLAWDRDRLTAADTVRLHLRDPFNAIRLEQAPPDAAGVQGGSKTSETWHDWLREGVLWRDPRPAIYLLEQQEGPSPPYRAFMARVPVGADAPLRFLETADPSRQAEHLHHFKAAQHHAGMPLVGYSDPDQVIAEALLEVSLDVEPDMVVTGPDGVEHRMWILTDTAFALSLQELLTGHELLVLAGGERLEAYRELVGHLESNGAPAAPMSMPAVFTDLEEPSLRVEVPHRLLQIPQTEPPVGQGWVEIRLEGEAPDVSTLENGLTLHAPAGSGNLVWLGAKAWPRAWVLAGAHTVDPTLGSLDGPPVALADDLHEVWVGLASERFSHALLVAPPRPVDLSNRTPAPPWRIQPRIPVGLVMAGLEE